MGVIMGKPMLLLLGLVAQVFSNPSEYRRFARQTSSGAVAGAGSSESGQGSEAFGIGAAAGIGGLGRSVGLGSFKADTKSNPFLPWGAFAGMNLGSGGRIGAGCSGLSCGVQLGEFSIATPQLIGMGRNFLNNQRRKDVKVSDKGSVANIPQVHDGTLETSETFITGVTLTERVNDVRGFLQDLFRNRYGDQQAKASTNYDDASSSSDESYGNNGNYRQSFPSAGNGNFNPFSLLQRPFQFIQQFQQQNRDQFQHGQQNVADFARFGAGGNGQYFGGASTSTFGSSNGGRPVFSSTSTHVDPEGKVTTIESDSDHPDRITTGRIGNNGGTNGVYASSGTNVDSDGKVTSYKDSGSF